MGRTNSIEARSIRLRNARIARAVIVIGDDPVIVAERYSVTHANVLQIVSRARRAAMRETKS